MADYLVATHINGRVSFVIMHDPGPWWQKRFFRDQTITVVDLLPSDDISLDDVWRLHWKMPDVTLQALIDHWRLSRELGVKPT